MKISASLMCANQLEIMRNITSLIKLEVDLFHFDVIDSNFVSNFALNLGIIREARALTRIPFDVHLMVQKPSLFLDKLIDYGVDIIIFHVECAEDVLENIRYLREKRVHIGLAFNIETPASVVEKYIPLIDYVLVISHRTGFSEVGVDSSVLSKINKLYSYIKAKNFAVQIICDGEIMLADVEQLYVHGVDIVVAGTSLLFNNQGFSRNLKNVRSLPLDASRRLVSALNRPDKDSTCRMDAPIREAKLMDKP